MNLNLLSNEEQNQLTELITTSEKIVLCAHKSPDGDAVGACLAWKNYLQQIGKSEVSICLPDAFPDFLQWMPGTQEIIRYDKKPDAVKQLFDDADLVCYLDFNQTSRVDAMSSILEECKAKRLLIDHHLDPDTNNSLTISHTELSSTCELVFSIIYQLGGYEAMSKTCAQCIYCGMMTDTGGFTYNSNRPEIYYIISLLLSKGIDKDAIYKRVFNNYSANAIKLRGHILYNKLKIVDHLHTAYFTVTKEEMKRFHFIKGDLEGVVNIPQQIKGLKLSIALREDTERPNLVLVSLRSGNGFRCQPMAAKFFNGGGHAEASGGKLFCSIEEAEQIVLKAILAFKDELQ